MKTFYTQFVASLSLVFLISGCAALQSNNSAKPLIIEASIDLINIQEDKVQITIAPTSLASDEIVFYIPQIVPGTYEYSNFGRFVEDFKAFDKKGNPLAVTALDQNSWKIAAAKKLGKITYWVNDTFDGPGGEEIYPMGGTNFDTDKTHLLNLHSMIGYFENIKESPYRLSVRSPKHLKAFTSLPAISKSDSLDVFNAERYFHIIDNPILYSEPNAVSFDLDNIKVGLAIYSPSGTHQAAAYQEAIQEMMVAQKKFLGESNNTSSYDILLHLMNMETLQYYGGVMGALEHHTSTTVVFVDAMQPAELTQSLVDVVSHEFFHTLTPLNVHSEEIHNFEYNTPLMSKHLWMYEGTTEYFANLFQINQGLIDAPDFYGRMNEKISYGQRYDDTMSFTAMSAGIVEEPYAANYGNVYQKGALINMCLDILIREKSEGEKGILWVMKNLAQRYGKDKPFQDADLIDEIVAMTYPEVGNFFETYVEGTTPINYNDYLSKVGLTEGETEVKLPAVIFADAQNPVFTPQDGGEKGPVLVISGLNTSLEAMGVQLGDVVLGLDGQMLPEINQENGAAINAVFTPSFMWDAAKEFTLTVARDGETLNLSGKVGTPSTVMLGVVEDAEASEAAVALRKAWLFN
jgi:predicted metalloprotease with PDZ domain